MNYYQRYLRKLSRGVKINPRGMITTAVFNETFVFTPGTCWRRPHDNPAIGFIEGVQFIAGVADKLAIQAVAPGVDISLFGPTSFYGPRTAGQFEDMIEELRKYPTTRRAVILVAHPDDGADTLPCTTALNFYIVPNSGELSCTVAMRSSDAVWGLPYDMIQFGMVTTAVASCIGRKPGEVLINITNAHIYEDHDGGSVWETYEFTMPKYPLWSNYVEWAKAIVEFRPSAAEIKNLFNLHRIENE